MVLQTIKIHFTINPTTYMRKHVNVVMHSVSDGEIEYLPSSHVKFAFCYWDSACRDNKSSYLVKTSPRPHKFNMITKNKKNPPTIKQNNK